jgi:hypothetical protein
VQTYWLHYFVCNRLDSPASSFSNTLNLSDLAAFPIESIALLNATRYVWLIVLGAPRMAHRFVHRFAFELRDTVYSSHGRAWAFLRCRELRKM